MDSYQYVQPKCEVFKPQGDMRAGTLVHGGSNWHFTVVASVIPERRGEPSVRITYSHPDGGTIQWELDRLTADEIGRALRFTAKEAGHVPLPE